MLDLLAARPFLSGVVSLEHVLHHGARYRISRDALIGAVAAKRPFRHAVRVAAVVDFVGDKSESPGESLSKVRIWEAEMPLPIQQKRFIGTDGREYFVDFYFPEADAIGESDGYAKYENPEFLKGRTPTQAFRDEKRREDALRPLVRSFVRWDWSDAWLGAPLYAKLSHAGIRPVSRR